jgi:IclR family transcriptional regulator, acetate operon repressor
VISIAGPRARLSFECMQKLAPALLQAAADLAATRGASALFGRPPLGKG